MRRWGAKTSAATVAAEEVAVKGISSAGPVSDGGGRQKRDRAYILVGFFIFALVFVLDAVFGLINNRALGDYFQQERDARTILQQTQIAYGLTVDAETGQRGFLLLDDPRYLSPYQKATEELPAALIDLRVMTHSDSGETNLISEWEIASREKLRELKETIALYRQGRKLEALAIVRSGKGEGITEKLRNLRDQLDKREQVKLAATTRSVASANRAIEIESYATALCALALLTVFFFLLKNYLEVQRQREIDKERQASILEEKVIERTEELRLANEELEAFTYSVSHDLRAPLRTIFGFCTVLEDDLGKNASAEIKDSLGRIQRATIKMGTLIDDLLRLSRVTRMEIIAEKVDLSDLFQNYFLEANSKDRRRATFNIQPKMNVRGDGRLLRIVVENLAGNAWKFTAERDETLIEVGIVDRKSELEVFVRDNGAGFEQKYAHKIFEPFQRLHNDTRFEGTGVGLAIVTRIIQRHGGTIKADGLEGEGATVFFTIPKILPKT